MIPDKLSILLVEDNPADARLIEVLFTARGGGPVAVRKAETLADTLALLADPAAAFDLVLLDLNLPDSESLETLHAVAERAPQLPIVVLSGHSDETIALAAVREGAQDYLVKGRIDPDLLNRAARYAIERKGAQRDRDVATQALARSEERLRLVIDASTDGIWDWNILTGDIIWSDRMYELLRRPKHTAVRADTLQLPNVHPDDRPLVAAALKAHLEEKAAYIVECRLMRGDGTYGHFHISGKTVRDAQGSPIRMAGSISDITERCRAEAALRASEQRFQSFMDNSPAVAFMKDEHGRYVYVNAVFQRLLSARSEQQPVGRSDADVWPADVAERLRAADKAVLATNRSMEFTEVIPQHDGPHEWLTVKFPMLESRERRYLCGVGVDITERRRAEAALREADEKLRQSQKMEAVGQLASGIAHDFNNLLTAIRGYASLARNTLSANHSALESLDQVEEASRQAAGVASALLTFSRKNVTEKVPVHVATAVESAARLFRRTLPTSVRLVLDLAGAEDYWILADNTQLQQVIINLGLNARDAIGPNEGTLTISLEPARKDGTPLRTPRNARQGRAAAPPQTERPPAINIVVRDTGMGMSPEVQARIFEPFFTTKPRGRGTGLGLAVIHGIIQNHNAGVSVVSSPGKGATFTVTFPTTTAPVREAEPGTPVSEPLGGGIALLAEHNQLVRGLLASMLATLGYEVVHASSTDEGLAQAARPDTPIDLLVADVELPGKGGFRLLEDIRARGQNLCAVIVAASAAIDTSDLGSGVVLLKKPFQLADLRRALAGFHKHSSAGNTP